MFDTNLISQIKDHVKSEYPKEACGIIVQKDGAACFIPCENKYEDPEIGFQIDPKITNTFIVNKTLVAVVHSHCVANTSESSAPSKMDMEGQILTGVIWGIFDTDGNNIKDPYWWGDFILDEPLIGADFKSGINDCYSLIRKWYWQKKGLKLLDFARDMDWWLNGENMYEDNFERAGFFQISKKELENGDLVLGKVKSDRINHAGIYLNNSEDGNGLILHHLSNRLSRRETANNWVDKAELFLRYQGNV